MFSNSENFWDSSKSPQVMILQEELCIAEVLST